MNDNQAKCFIEAAECLNFTLAARRLYVTQPTLSRQIQNLEAELNVKLFDRTNNIPSLTPEGQALYKGLKPLSRDIDKLIRQVRNHNVEEKPEFHIGLAQELVLDPVMLGSIRHLQETYPDLLIDIDTYKYGDLRKGLEEESLDITFSVLLNSQRKSSQFDGFILDRAQACMAVEESYPVSGDHILSMEELEELMSHYKLLCIEPGTYDSNLIDPMDHWRKNIGWQKEELPKTRFIEMATGIPLLVAAGQGVTMTHRHSFVSVTPNVKLLPIQLSHTYDIAVSFPTTANHPYRKTILEYLQQYEVKED